MAYDKDGNWIKGSGGFQGGSRTPAPAPKKGDDTSRNPKYDVTWKDDSGVEWYIDRNGQKRRVKKAMKYQTMTKAGLKSRIKRKE